MAPKRKIVSVEGPWASGKTATLRRIAELGCEIRPSVVPEIYREKGPAYTPRHDPREFTELFLELKEGQYLEATKEDGDPIFFDRAFFSPIVLRLFLGLDVPDPLIRLAKSANIHGPVFIFEPIPIEGFKDGWPRQHFSYEDSLLYGRITEDIVKDLGFPVHKVPYRPTIDERAQHILRVLAEIAGEETGEDDDAS